MKYLPLLIIFALFVSCKKNTTEQINAAPVAETTLPYSEASYQMTVSLNWQSPQFSVPAGVHVTALIGMVHSKDTSLWMPGKLATKDLEDVAEIGNTIQMNRELDSISAKNKALSKFSIAH